LIAWYLRTVGASSLGGVAATPIAILLWIYYEAQILLVGAQFASVLGEEPEVAWLRRHSATRAPGPQDGE